jgi:hypothetical protein
MCTGFDAPQWLIDSMDNCGKIEDGVSDASPMAVQIGGDHYKKYAIQPAEYALRNGLGFVEANVVKYTTRWRNKGGVEDLRKAIHYLEMLIEFEEGK